MNSILEPAVHGRGRRSHLQALEFANTSKIVGELFDFARTIRVKSTAEQGFFFPVFADFCYKSFQEFLEIQRRLDFKYYIIGNEFGGDCAFGAIVPF